MSKQLGNPLRKNMRFWDPGDRDPSDIVHMTLDAMSTQIQIRRQEAIRNAHLTDCDTTGLGITQSGNVDIPAVNSVNALASAGETSVAEISGHKITPFAITEAGTSEEQAKAAEFNKMTAALFRKHVFPKLYRWVWDAHRWSYGVAKVTQDGRNLCVDRVFPFEVHVDPFEVRLGWEYMRTGFHRYLVDREVLYWTMKDLGVEKDKLERIWTIPNGDKDMEVYQLDTSSDLVPLCEGWHKKSHEIAKDGKYFCGVRGATFIFEDWAKDRIPLQPLFHREPGIGIEPKSFTTRHWPAQKYLDEISESQRRSIKKLQGAKIVVFGDSDVQVLTGGQNQEATIIKVSGNRAPQVFNPEPFHPAMDEIRRRIPSEILQMEGIPEQWATGQVPSWMHRASGRAQQVAVEEGSKKMEPALNNVESFLLGVGELMFDALRDLSEQNGGYLVQYADGEQLRSRKFSEIDLGKGSYELKVQPANARFRSVSAQMDALDKLLERKVIDEDEFASLIDNPDIASIYKRRRAGRSNVLKNIETILADGKPMSAFPGDPFELILSLGSDALNEARLKGDPEERQAMLLDYIESAREMMARRDAPLAPQDVPGPPAGGPPPGAPPGPPPGMGGPPPGMPMPPPGMPS